MAKTIQERAWSSPIWYRPEGLARLTGSIRPYGDESVLTLKLRLGNGAALDPETEDITLAVRDDDEVYRVTIPAGTLEAVRPGSFRWTDPSGRIGGVDSFKLDQPPNGPVRIRLRTVPLELTGADLVDHFMEVSLSAGTTRIVTAPLWRATGRRLATSS